jgi:hypothetical protein
MCLADVQAQLVSNLEEVQKRYKENDDEHKKEQPNFRVGTLPHIYHSKKNL